MTSPSNVLIVEDHRAILDHILANAERIFGYASLTVIANQSALNDLNHGAQFDMGLIDPGMPGIPHDDVSERVSFATRLLKRITDPQKAAIFTGIATELERQTFASAGFGHYLSKADTGIPELRAFFRTGAEEASFPAPIQRTWTFLTDAELEAHALREQYSDLTYGELAVRAGKSEAAFTQALKRARRKIREAEG